MMWVQSPRSDSPKNLRLQLTNPPKAEFVNNLAFFFSLFHRFKFLGVSQDNRDKNERHLAFTNLVNHLRHLVTGPESISDTTRQELRSRLAEKDSAVVSGDYRKAFDMNDLNIWEDICVLMPAFN